MKRNMMKNDFKPLLIEQLSDALCIEKESELLLPKLQSVTTKESLKDTLQAQLVTVQSSIEKLEALAEIVEVDVLNANCKAVKIIVEKAHDYLEADTVSDAGILSHLERINQYKSAVYNSAIRFARELNNIKLQQELQNLSNHAYNMIDRLGRIDSDQSDERAINSL
ncbi:DUF892 family protein [Psychroserpens mesophilus]|uniref:DUF892 family protein n=1 Tax=Psychroserpens mesophilus TaxID=325473 RepID=UPI000A06943A|nr:DUF892 family protein [Psychroserpens mesophilus]